MAPGGVDARPKAVLGTDDLERVAGQLKVLANPKRLQILQLLVRPHYIEEIASHLKTARQTAQEHVDKLLELGLVERRRGRRDTGPVTEFIVAPQRLFSVFLDLGKLGGLEPEAPARDDLRAMTTPVGTGVSIDDTDDVPRLHIVHGMHVGRAMPLTGDGPWLIGRDPAAQASLDYDPFISNRHAEVRRHDDGTYELSDLYSSNGTTLDWAPLERGAAVPLEHGAIVGVGKSLLVFKRP